MEDIFSRTLITGAGGMVGSYIDFGIKTTRKDLDITDIDQVRKVIKKYSPKIILHLAAETDVDLAEREPTIAYSINTIGTYNLALVARELGIKLIYISTGGVFDGEKKTPYRITDKPNPQSHYSRSKYLGEELVRNILPDSLIVRTGWIFGGGPGKDHKFVGKIAELLLQQNTLQVVRSNKGSPIYAKDLVSIIKKLLLENKKGIYHVVNKGVCTRYDMAEVIIHSLKPHAKLVAADPSMFHLAVKRINSEALQPNVSSVRHWKVALRDYLDTEWKQKFFEDKKV